MKKYKEIQDYLDASVQKELVLKSSVIESDADKVRQASIRSNVFEIAKVYLKRASSAAVIEEEFLHSMEPLLSSWKHNLNNASKHSHYEKIMVEEIKLSAFNEIIQFVKS